MTEEVCVCRHTEFRENDYRLCHGLNKSSADNCGEPTVKPFEQKLCAEHMGKICQCHHSEYFHDDVFGGCSFGSDFREVVGCECRKMVRMEK
jgi:hypothetical protein